MKLLPTLAAAAALLAGVSGSALADWVPYGKVGGWQVSSGEQFEGCVASGDYENGTTLSFYINVSGGLSISVSHEKWNIPEGGYEVQAQVDRTKPGRMSAYGKGTWVMFNLQGSESDFNLLRYGRVLYVTVGAQSYEYNLVRSEAMLKALGQCAASRATSANPFSGAGSNPPASTETPSNPFRRL